MMHRSLPLKNFRRAPRTEPHVATEAAPARRAHGSTLDDGASIAPTATNLDAHDEQFFVDGEVASQRMALEALPGAPRPDEHDAEAEHEEHLARARAARRKKLGRYVAASVAVSTALCLAALVRVGIRMASTDDDASLAAATVASVSGAPAVTSGATAIAPVAVAASAAATSSGAVPATRATPTAHPGPLAPHAKSALEEKEAARHLLGRNRTKDAMAAAERSVALDPSDAEAWLILGAIHQDLGHGANARASFRSCAKEAKKGPIAECRAMLR